MNIVSLFYLAFVVAVALVYFIAPRRIRWGILLGASLVIYLYCGRRMIVWLLLTSLSIYVGGLLIDRRQKRYLGQLEAGGELDKNSKRALKKKNELCSPGVALGYILLYPSGDQLCDRPHQGQVRGSNQLF